jgi:hypothetical protein
VGVARLHNETGAGVEVGPLTRGDGVVVRLHDHQKINPLRIEP